MGLIAIGDIHGCVDTLDALLSRLAPAEDDHLIFIGDYIDRGPDSKGVIDRLLTLRQSQQCTFLRGNHEAFMLAYLQDREFELWGMNGGVATLRSYAADGQNVLSPKNTSNLSNRPSCITTRPTFSSFMPGSGPS